MVVNSATWGSFQKAFTQRGIGTEETGKGVIRSGDRSRERVRVGSARIQKRKGRSSAKGRLFVPSVKAASADPRIHTLFSTPRWLSRKMGKMGNENFERELLLCKKIALNARIGFHVISTRSNDTTQQVCEDPDRLSTV